MKKALALTLALTMLLSLAACGDKPSSSATPPTNGSSSNAGTNAPAADPYPEKNIDFIIPVAPGGAMETAIADVSVKAVTSLTNGTLAVVVATLLAPVLRTALEQAGVGGEMARR